AIGEADGPSSTAGSSEGMDSASDSLAGGESVSARSRYSAAKWAGIQSEVDRYRYILARASLSSGLPGVERRPCRRNRCKRSASPTLTIGWVRSSRQIGRAHV